MAAIDIAEKLREEYVQYELELIDYQNYKKNKN